MCQLWPLVQALVNLLNKRQAKGHILNQKRKHLSAYAQENRRDDQVVSQGIPHRNDPK